PPGLVAKFFPSKIPAPREFTDEGHRKSCAKAGIGQPGAAYAGALRARRKRPRGCRAIEERDELATGLHSITSSVIASTPGGMVSPSVRAVLRLITSSKRVDCTTGKSPGLAPLRIRPT